MLKQEYKDVIKTIGINIKKIRERNKITLNELSCRTDISLYYLKKIETGVAYNIKTTQFVIIAEALNTKPTKLLENK